MLRRKFLQGAAASAAALVVRRSTDPPPPPVEPAPPPPAPPVYVDKPTPYLDSLLPRVDAPTGPITWAPPRDVGLRSAKWSTLDDRDRYGEPFRIGHRLNEIEEWTEYEDQDDIVHPGLCIAVPPVATGLWVRLWIHAGEFINFRDQHWRPMCPAPEHVEEEWHAGALRWTSVHDGVDQTIEHLYHKLVLHRVELDDLRPSFVALVFRAKDTTNKPTVFDDLDPVLASHDYPVAYSRWMGVDVDNDTD